MVVACAIPLGAAGAVPMAFIVYDVDLDLALGIFFNHDAFEAGAFGICAVCAFGVLAYWGVLFVPISLL